MSVDEVIKSRPLLEEVAGSGLGGLCLQREVHALVTAVLLRLSGLDALDLDMWRPIIGPITMT